MQKRKRAENFKVSALFPILAPWRGLEPPIYRLGGGCVIHYATKAYTVYSLLHSHFVVRSIYRLGGVRSILVSYGGIYTQFMLIYSTQERPVCQENMAGFFLFLKQRKQ